MLQGSAAGIILTSGKPQNSCEFRCWSSSEKEQLFLWNSPSWCPLKSCWNKQIPCSCLSVYPPTCLFMELIFLKSFGIPPGLHHFVGRILHVMGLRKEISPPPSGFCKPDLGSRIFISYRIPYEKQQFSTYVYIYVYKVWKARNKFWGRCLSPAVKVLLGNSTHFLLYQQLPGVSPSWSCF